MPKMSLIDLPVVPLLLVPALCCLHSGASDQCVVLRMLSQVAAVECFPVCLVSVHLVDVYLVFRRVGGLESRRTCSGPF